MIRSAAAGVAIAGLGEAVFLKTTASRGSRWHGELEGIVAAILSPGVLTEKVIDDVIAGRIPTYPALPANAYFNPDTAAEYFITVGQEPPPKN